MVLSLALLALASIVAFINAHPGETVKDKRAEAKVRSDYIASLENTDLAHCAGTLSARGVLERTIERRRLMVDNLRVSEERSNSVSPCSHIQRLSLTSNSRSGKTAKV
jgi:hypothetical protein